MMPDASSEKELGNAHFKQKRYPEAIKCYSKSIALSPTAAAFANRAMAYLKLQKFEEAENDCTAAICLDDRYVKAYSRRATARKELRKFKGALDDCEFAITLEPNNLELRKQYDQTKASYVEEASKYDTFAGVPSKVISEAQGTMSYSSYSSDEQMPDATAERELGNEFFKQKKYDDAIECYSRSIALSPTSAAFANRSMAYLKLKRFREAEDDCTEALNMDDRHVKAYSRRATARKELKKFKEAMEDCEFAVTLEPNNPDLRKQYDQTKALYMQTLQGNSEKAHDALVVDRMDIDNVKATPVKGVIEIDESPRPIEISFNNTNMKEAQSSRRKNETKPKVQELASRAASRLLASSSKPVTIPKSAYEFEVAWRALANDSKQQSQLLKSIPPATLPQLFKNALSASVLVDIVKCTSTFFREDAELAISILENLAKVPRFDMIVMCLSPMHCSELQRVWREVSALDGLTTEQIGALERLRPKYWIVEWQDDRFADS